MRSFLHLILITLGVAIMAALAIIVADILCGREYVFLVAAGLVFLSGAFLIVKQSMQ